MGAYAAGLQCKLSVRGCAELIFVNFFRKILFIKSVEIKVLNEAYGPRNPYRMYENVS